MLHPSVALDLANQRLEELRAETRRSGRAGGFGSRKRRSRWMSRVRRLATRPRPAVS